MAVGVTVKASYDFNLMLKRTPKLMANMINDVADILRDDMKLGAQRGEDIRGKKFVDLQPLTVRAKRRKGSATAKLPLFDTGRMIGLGSARGTTGIWVKKRAKPKSLSAIITLPRNRQVAGRVHNEGLGPQPQRRFFYEIGKDNLKRPRPKIDKTLRNTSVKIARSAHKGAA